MNAGTNFHDSQSWLTETDPKRIMPKIFSLRSYFSLLFLSSDLVLHDNKNKNAFLLIVGDRIRVKGALDCQKKNNNIVIIVVLFVSSSTMQEVIVHWFLVPLL